MELPGSYYVLNNFTYKKHRFLVITSYLLTQACEDDGVILRVDIFLTQHEIVLIFIDLLLHTIIAFKKLALLLTRF